MELMIQYAAGFMDGEGTIYLEKVKNPKNYAVYRLMVAIPNNAIAPLKRIQALTKGGGIYKTAGQPRKRTLEFSSHQAVKFLRLVQPYLKLTFCQAWVALCYDEYLRRAKHRLPLSTHEIEIREATKSIISKMNHSKSL